MSWPRGGDVVWCGRWLLPCVKANEMRCRWKRTATAAAAAADVARINRETFSNLRQSSVWKCMAGLNRDSIRRTSLSRCMTLTEALVPRSVTALAVSVDGSLTYPAAVFNRTPAAMLPTKIFKWMLCDYVRTSVKLYLFYSRIYGQCTTKYNLVIK